MSKEIEEEIEKNPIDFKMDIEQAFEPDDCIMVMENIFSNSMEDLCHDYPCNDCVTRFIKNYKRGIND
tara:strand:- start:31 stop:234 length:204 start_codon:yes stop_codon:yes gene_type:complete